MNPQHDCFESLREFLGTMLSTEKECIEPETALFGSNRIDSMNLISLINYIESDFGIKISPLEVSEKNFESVKNLEQFIRSKINPS